MIIRRLDDLLGTEAEVHCNTWVSRRLLLKRDGMGFSMHDTVIRAGTETPMWYKNHLEAVYCIEGKGTVEDRATGEVHALEPGTLYALDKNDRHIVRAEQDLRLVCVFNPPVTGQEVHDADGGYELVDDEEEAA